jgi:hypothetical protein
MQPEIAMLLDQNAPKSARSSDVNPNLCIEIQRSENFQRKSPGTIVGFHCLAYAKARALRSHISADKWTPLHSPRGPQGPPSHSHGPALAR